MNQNSPSGAQGQGAPSIPYWVASDIRIAILTGLKVLIPSVLAAIAVTLFLGGQVGDSFGSSSDDGLGYFPNLDLFRSVLGTLSLILGAGLEVFVNEDFIALEAYLLPVHMLPGIAAFLLMKYRPVAIHGDWRRALAFALKVSVVAGIAAFIIAAASGFKFDGYSSSVDDYIYLSLNFEQTRAFFVTALMTGVGVLSSPVVRKNFSNLSLVNKVQPAVPIVIKSISLALLVFWVVLLVQGGQAAELNFSDNATWMFWTTLTVSVTIALLLMFAFLGAPPTSGNSSFGDSQSLSASELVSNTILLWGGRFLFAALLGFFVYRHLVKTQPRDREQIRDLIVGVIAISAVTAAISSFFTKFSVAGMVDSESDSASLSVGFFSALLIPGLWAAGATIAIAAYWGSRNGLPLFTVSPPPPTVGATPTFQPAAPSGTPTTLTSTPAVPAGSQPRPTFETPRIERQAPAVENIRNILDDLPAPTPSVAPNLSLIWLSGSPVEWTQLGFQVRSSDQGSFESYDFIDFPNLSLGFLNSVGGMSEYAPSWTWKASTDTQLQLDGISTVVSTRIPPTYPGTHFLKIASVERIVLRTGSMDRTASAMTSALGTPSVDVHPHASGARQGVLQVGSVSLELIEQPNLDQSTLARIVGMVLLIDDFDTALEAFGPQRLGAVRTTTNGSQRSVTLRPELNLGLGIALKSKPITG